jgi:RNA recognition motif-containing protein
MKRIYVGNLSGDTSEDELRRVFEPYGEVLTVALVTRQGTGQFLGYGFVEMEGAEAAIAALHNTSIEGRFLTVHEARPRNFRPDQPSRW